jgi:tetratricopeptide (TPR) repeat protein
MKAGRTQMESGRFQEAEESFTEGINVLESAILPENENERPALLDLLSGAHLNRAIVRIRLNDPSSAIHDYSKAIANWENLRNQMGDRWPPAFEDNLQRAYRNLQLLKDRIRS